MARPLLPQLMKPDTKTYLFGRCLWAQQAGSSSFTNGHCPACDRHIVDIRNLTREQFEEVYQKSEEKLCVRGSPGQLVGRGTWVKYAAYVAVGVLPFAGGCGTAGTADGPSQSRAVAEESTVEQDDVFIGVIVEQMPEIVGGVAALQEQLRYPADAREASVEGRVVVQFVVDEQGEPQDVEVLQGLWESCDREAVRLVEQAAFVPGKQRGRPVAVRMTLPVTFTLPGK